MLITIRPSIKNKRVLFGVLSLSLLCAAIAVGFVNKKLSQRQPIAKPTIVLNVPPTSNTAVHESMESLPAASPQFDVSRSLIAGGGGTSSAGSFKVEGTIGQPAVGTTMSNGQFSQTGGFWQPETGAAGTPTLTPTATPTPTPTPSANVVQFSSSNYSVTEACTTVTVTVTRSGDTSGAASVDYSTSDVTATERRAYINAIGTLRFAPGETSKSFVVLINDDSYVEGPETFNVTLSNPSGTTLGTPMITTVTIIDNATEPATNVIDDPRNYVCQHYHDFLNRQPDQSGWDFWTNEITTCGADQACTELKRINVSAAFYLSIEFQDTGYLVERIYKASYGDANGTSTFGGSHQLPVPVIRLKEFLPDTQEIGQGVIVGQGNWQQQLENNKQAFTSEFVQRPRFTTAFPTSMTPAQFVDKLNQNARNPLSQSERDQLVSDLTGGVKTRAQVLRT